MSTNAANDAGMTTDRSIEKLSAARQKRIITLLSERDSMLVDELSEYLNVSTATVRRDLTKLEARGELQRTHGGAVRSPESTVFRLPETIPHVEAKQRIGEVAASLIEPGGNIALDAGTTTAAIVPGIRRTGSVRVVTNDLHIAYQLTGYETIEVNVTGGTIHNRFYSLGGPLALRSMSTLHVDMVFLGISALSPDIGITDRFLEAAQIKQAMIAAADTCVIVADSSKLGSVQFAHVADLSQINYLITDEQAPDLLLETVRDQGVTVLQSPAVCAAD